MQKNTDEVEAIYLGHIARIEPLIDSYFSLKPKAPYDVKRLGADNEGGLTFGYYQPPTSSNPRGVYLYNGSNLENRSLVGAAALIFHELIPGHHFHLALQQENEDLPKFQRNHVSTEMSAFNEGWAEYASSLGFEMGLYDDPYDRYGRLSSDAFLTARLVVDTGLNALGWSLEEAREYLKVNTTMSDDQIASETLRYSTDLPGQALAYRLGRDKFEELRREAKIALGDAFDVTVFHAAVLEQGALPLNVLEEHVRARLGISPEGDAK